MTDKRDLPKEIAVVHQQISACRICDNSELIEVLDLGEQPVNSVFPRTRNEPVPTAPLKLVKCGGDREVCGLLQLGHSYTSRGLLGSARAWSLEAHRSATARRASCVRTILQRLTFSERAEMSQALVFGQADYVELSGCSPMTAVQSPRDGRKVIISPFAMLSSQERPLQFLRAIRDALDHRTVWILQERYMPLMLQTNSYDSICHDYLACYALKQVKWMAHRSGLKIVDVELDDSGAGTASVALATEESAYHEPPALDSILDEEACAGLHTMQPYRAFAQRVTAGVGLLRTLLDRARDAGKSVCALGATNEGNVILQCCGATHEVISQVGETDSEKVGAFTPGTLLPIALEEEVLAAQPDFLLVLPWQLRTLFLGQPRLCGYNLLFSLPSLELVRTVSSR